MKVVFDMLGLSIGRNVFRHWWIIAAAFVAGLAVAVIVTSHTPPSYQSNLKFFVYLQLKAPATPIQTDDLLQRRIASYASVLTSERFMAQINQAGVDLPATELVKNVAISSDAAARTLAVTVTDSDAERSLQTATAIGTRAVDLIHSLEGTSDTQLNIVSGPAVNPVPVSPRPSLNLGIGGVLGLVVGIGAAVARSRSDKSIRSTRGMEGAGGVPLLTVIPLGGRGRNQRTIPALASDERLREAGRRLRTSIQFSPAADSLQLLAVTSSTRSSGTTTCAVLLARAFAAAGKSVCLVETDLRNPTLKAVLELPSSAGLSGVLQRSEDIADAIQGTDTPNLRVLAGGRPSPNSTEMLVSSQMTSLMNRLREKFDVVILDTAALLPNADAEVVCALSDAVIVVVEYGKTTGDNLEQAVRSLSAVHANAVGVVLNKFPVGRFDPAFSTPKMGVDPAPDEPDAFPGETSPSRHSAARISKS